MHKYTYTVLEVNIFADVPRHDERKSWTMFYRPTHCISQNRSHEAGVESNHTWRGRPLPAQNHKSRRDRERNDRETGERGERRERGDTTQGSLPRENGQVWEGPGSCGPQTTHHHMIFLRGTVQYVRFPGGPPPEYWTRPWLLSFGDRTGSGVSNQV